MSASHLDFYKKFKISPVRQDISDLERHFRRRQALYRHLGILPGYVAGRRVCEVGPGSGYNSIYTASLGPAYYELVEGNPTGIEQIRDLFSAYPQWTADIAITAARIEDYRATAAFDLVLCEGVLTGVTNPEEILNALAQAVKLGGMLVVSCVDHLSQFPETIRRVFADLATHSEQTLEQKVASILPLVSPHLQTLSGMSRRHDDWIIDNLIHPGAVIPLINFPEVIAVLAHEFQFLSSSPNFVQDWRWYKDIVGGNYDFNHNAIEQYWRHAHNLMDFRITMPPRDPIANIRLYDLCTEARLRVERFEKSRAAGLLVEFRELLEEISADLSVVSPLTTAALDEAADLLKTGAPERLATASLFAPLFGRGMQYLSFTREE
ncbi:tRNA (mo5U34)-methyltransferase [mine drainage metagenome]|uniref:tRNA (Mo5U34)-methyltransferase n=1 Tax=mine drainage metagenome TaxID=410659 RepID=A0A1J5RC83_9ZZZZ